jgi:hypothetical protein
MACDWGEVLERGLGNFFRRLRSFIKRVSVLPVGEGLIGIFKELIAQGWTDPYL